MGVMKIIIETERLYQRTFLSSDGLLFFDFNNDPDVIKYTALVIVLLLL